MPFHTLPLQIDLQFMCELAAVVPVVPVLAKADTMTTDELKVGRWACKAAYRVAWNSPCAARMQGACRAGRLVRCAATGPRRLQLTLSARASFTRARCHAPPPRQEFRHRVRSALGKAGVASPFSRDALDDAGARHGPPFALVCSSQMDLEVGRSGPAPGCGTAAHAGWLPARACIAGEVQPCFFL